MVRRLTRILKWFALALTLVFAAAFAVNFRTGFAYSAPSCEVAGSRDHLIVITRSPADLAMKYVKLGWSRGNPGGYIMNPGVQRWTTAAPWGTGTAVPLWMPLTAFGFVTITLFALDFKRRVRPGHCSCGYDLRGLSPGAACPECGRA